MEWMNRSDRPGQPTASQSAAPHTAQPTNVVTRQNKLASQPGILRWAFIALLFSATVLIIATIGFTVFGGNNSGKAESTFVNKKQMQAVFLNGGQVYFGKIGTLNTKYLSLDDIYYLRVNQQVQPNQTTSSTSANDISLVKLGCELHGPQDQMVINREQVIFWENLKDDGQVAQAVAKYKTDNPDQKCTQANSTGTGASTTTPTTNNTTPTTTPSTKK